MSQLAEAVAKRGGAILIVDYGYAETQTGETLQAVRDHQYADPLEKPGETDLSAHVDFSVLATGMAEAGLTAHGLSMQGAFLERLGIRQRADALAKANPEQAEEIDAAVNRLTNPNAMGTLFKVFCAASPGLLPPGLAEVSA
jgi:SAM-dependent MidA family methyltransferase